MDGDEDVWGQEVDEEFKLAGYFACSLLKSGYFSNKSARQPLTMKPEMLTADYWTGRQHYKPQNAFAAELDSLAGVNDSTLMAVQPTGIAGDPVPYQFRTDSIVTIILMLGFFLVVKVISGSRYYLREQIKDFFHHRQRENLFAQRTQSEMRGQVFLIFQTCIMLGVLFFDYTQEYQADVFNQVSPYKILGMSVGIFAIYFALKAGCYTFINNIFFSRKQKAVVNSVFPTRINF